MGSKPEIIITGLGHAGSTYLVNIFDQLGINIGNEDTIHDDDDLRGREYSPAVNIHHQISDSISEIRYRPYVTRLDPSKVFNDEIRDRFKDIINQHDYPQLIKSPNTGWAWFIDLFEPKHVIVCYRDPIGWTDSMLRWNKKYRPNDIASEIEIMEAHNNIFGSTLAALEYHNISYNIISYPKSTENPSYLAEKIKPSCRIAGLHGSQLNHDIIHAFREVSLNG